MSEKEKLWIRHLDCGHFRETNIAFMMGKYEEPKIGDDCFCRECMNTSKITKVEEDKDNEEKEFLKQVARGMTKDE